VGDTATIVRNPVADKEFERAVAEAMHPGLDDPTQLQGALRASYPKAVVRPRELAGERGIVWYVYREGHWVSGREAKEPA
jgi:hypothetical protein